MTMMLALKFIWASESSEMTSMFRTMAAMVSDGAMQEAESSGRTIDLSQYDADEAGKRMFKTYIFIYPFFFVSFMCALALIFRAWGRKLPYIARVRYIFAIIIPGSVIGLLTTFMMLPFKGQAYQIVSFISMALIFLTYLVTAYRGAYPATISKGGRIGRSFAVALAIMIMLLIAQFVAMFLAIIPLITEVSEMIKVEN